MICLPNIAQIYCKVIVFSGLFIIITHGKDCTENLELKNILQKYLHDATLADLEGTWMDVYVSSEDISELDASYSVIKLNSVRRRLTVLSKEIVKYSDKEIPYKEKIRLGDKNGIFRWTGTYDDGSLFQRVIYLLYADKNVIAHYSCDIDETLEDGWDILIAVKSSQKKKLMSSNEDVQLSLNKALTKLNNLKQENEKFKEHFQTDFGFMGEFSQVDFSKLRP